MSEGTHDTHDYEHVWPPYGVHLAQPDTRTADELATLRSDLVMALGHVQELNQRLAVVEERLAKCVPAGAGQRSGAATAIAAFLRRQGKLSQADQRDALQAAMPSAVAETLAEKGFGNFTTTQIANAMAEWTEAAA